MAYSLPMAEQLGCASDTMMCGIMDSMSIICTVEQGSMSDFIREGFTKNLSNYGYCIAICL